MSNLNVAGQGRALPFTGFAALPLVALGAIVSLAAGVAALVRPKAKAARLG